MNIKPFSLGLCIAIALAAAALCPRTSNAQPYFTNANSGSMWGAQQYNQSLPSPYNPSQTIARQINEGIMAGVFTNSGGGFAAVTNTYQAQFGTYTNYSAPPACFFQPINPSPAGTTNPAVVLFTTTTNFAVYFGANSNCNYSLEFVGH